MATSLIKHDRQRRIVEFVRSCSLPPSSRDIACAFGMPERTTQYVIHQMVESQMLVRVEGWIVAPQ